jgi:hypothetical protein
LGVQSLTTLYKIQDEASGIGAGFLVGFFGFPMLLIIPSLRHTHLKPGLKYAPGSTLSHPLVFKLGASPLIPFLTGCRVK